MTEHIQQPSIRDALSQVLSVAAQDNLAGLDVEERANVALTNVVETSDIPIPLALQRTILTQAIDALSNGDTESAVAPQKPRFTDAVRPEAKPETVSIQAPKPAAAELATEEKPARLVPLTPPAETPTAEAPVPAQPAEAPQDVLSPELMALASQVQASLGDILDFSDLANETPDAQEALIRDAILGLSKERKMHLNGREVSDLVRAVLADMLGLGPLEPLLADPRVTDIMVNGPHQTYVERGGKLELTQVKFRDNAHVTTVASRIVSAVGRRIDESHPMMDARLKDGSRVNVAVPPLAIDGTTITIRKFPSAPVRLEALVDGGSLSAQMAGFLGLAAYLRLNVLVSGGTGSGKTTLMNAMSQYIRAGERLVTIEDAAELRFQQPHVVRFETRPPNVEGTGEVTMRTLVRNALRMRPDRIIIGEIRGDEVLDLLQAMNTGHDGSMSTLHANSPREALTRVESMAALAGFAPGTGVVRRQLADAVHLIVQVSRMRDGKRRVTSISEIAGIEGETITLQDLFTFQAGEDATRSDLKGQFKFSGYRPRFAKRAADYGVADELDTILQG